MVTEAKADFGKRRSPEAIRQRKQRVLNAAVQEFAEKGYAAADMDHIAEAAKVGKGTIYRYYTNKERLFQAVADEAIGRLRDFVFSALQSASAKPPIEQLKMTGKAFLAFFDENRLLLEIFLHERSQFRGMIQSEYLRAYSENIEVFEDLMGHCMAQGIVKHMEPRALLDTIGDMLVGLVYMWGVRREKEPLAQKWSLVEETIFRGILVA
jgi:AcrR family transcriptional regulator